jgi:hypothetical protein
MHIRAQNAAVVVRKFINAVRFEIFEVLPPASIVMSTNGKLLCSYPGPVIKVSTEIFARKYFLEELASFLTQMDVDVLDSTATAVKAASTVREVRESAHPKYISELLVGILRGFGQLVVVDRITKRIGDEVLWKNANKPWRRSALWLVVRVALQASEGHDNIYKPFILFFHAHVLRLCVQRAFPSELLFEMRVKMARRLAKLGSAAVSGYVCQAVYDAATETERLLQNRWSVFQRIRSISLPWRPEELDFVTDTAITLCNSRTYLAKVLAPAIYSFPSTVSLRFSQFQPILERETYKFCLRRSAHRPCRFRVICGETPGLLGYLISSQQYAPNITASCVEQYFTSAQRIYGTDPEVNSVMILTIMDLGGLWISWLSDSVPY